MRQKAGGQRHRHSPKSLANPSKPDTIGIGSKSGEASDVYFVTRLDIEKYSCVTEGITTDEVIITDERIAHIEQRHPGDFERFSSYLAEIISDPDYILRSDQPNTGFVLKEIERAGERFEMIVRLRVGGDPENYKNSVLTFLRIKEKKWNRYLRNKKILYKKE